MEIHPLCIQRLKIQPLVDPAIRGFARTAISFCRAPHRSAIFARRLMHRQYIADLQARDSVDEIYRVADKQVRSNRQGNDYLLLQLMDRTGQISGLRWNAGQSLYETFQKGDYLRVLGNTQLHNGLLQIIVQDFETVPPSKVDPQDFTKTSVEETEQLFGELRERLLGIQNPHLKRLVQSYLADEQLLNRFQRAPAGIKTHHAYEGGLLRHVVDLMRIGSAIAPNYPQLDADILTVGIFLHDLGKIDELSYDADLSYSDPGQLLGHLVQGAVELELRATRIAKETNEPLPDELVWRLQHMIISHHGQLEHGSPKLPMTIEAIVLAHIDNLDAKINTALEAIESDRNTDSEWTAFHPNMGRKFFKPSARR
ncbi:MAG: HD domain-containing protein [bacterium]|nr:HD domain-containing protein [bacterium]